MLLSSSQAIVIGAFLWLPLFLVAGALYAMLTRWSRHRAAPRLRWLWLSASGAVSAVIVGYGTYTGRSWHAHPPLLFELEVAAIFFVISAVCLGAASLLLHRLSRRGKPSALAEVAAGATSAAGAWIALCLVVFLLT